MTTIAYIILFGSLVLNVVLLVGASAMVAEKKERDKWLARYLTGGPHSMN